MREIKFRWFSHGEMRHEFDGWCEGIGINEAIKSAEKDYDAITMQFTGLHDKNGVPIFEGDVVSAPFANGACRKDKKIKHFNVVVSISPESGASIYMPAIAWVGDYRFYPSLSECEVIGNIHQNPELLG